MPDVKEAAPTAKGRVRSFLVKDRRREPRTRWSSNLVLRSWAAIVGKLLLTGEQQYRISGMYIEFENVPSPGDVSAVPSFDRDPDSGVAYYDGLALSATRDYLRVPMVAGTLESSDEELYPDGNLVTFFAQTGGVVGVHGKDFGEVNNSVVIGAALVAQRVQADATQDLVLSRFYFDSDEQQPKLDTGQVGIEWELELQ